MGDDHQFLARAARADPTDAALQDFVGYLVTAISKGLVPASYLTAGFGWLAEFAELAEVLRAGIKDNLDVSILDYQLEWGEDSVKKAGTRLQEALALERPTHYVDLARRARIHNGSIVIIGAGFSYDSYVGLVREMEGIVRPSLFVLGVDNPGELYASDERKCWQVLSENWQVFQGIVAQNMAPKRPSDQHYKLAALFKRGDVAHIVSVNWDDLVQKAYAELFGEEIAVIRSSGLDSEHALWKLHGDVRDVGTKWVLPYEPGYVIPELRAHLFEPPRPGFVIGYREQETAVVEGVLLPLERGAGLTRLRPDVVDDPPASIQTTADRAMRSLKAAFDNC